MKKETQIVSIIDRESPGMLDHLSKEDGISKESLVRKVLEISYGRVVRTHHLRATGAQKT